MSNKKDVPKKNRPPTEPKLLKFALHWLGGDVEVVTGRDLSDAFTKAGYGAGAVNALNYWKSVE